jgi:parallel beta-helix repeat protein
MKKSVFVFIGFVVCLLCTVATGIAGVPHTVNFGGRSTDAEGAALNGSHSVRFRIDAGSSLVKTWCVPGEIPTIKEAVEDSASYGDTVLVAPGIYDTTSGEVFPINMKNGVILISEAGALLTIINANSTERVFNCKNVDSTTVVTGFTFTGGSAPHGGGILCTNSFLKINDNIVEGNTAAGIEKSGGGLYCYQGAPRIINNNITGNNARNYCGGGIYCLSCQAVIEGNRVAKNTSKFGGGIFNNNSSPLIRNNTIVGNHALNSGGGLDCYGSSNPLITANVIAGNSCGTHGAGIACCYSSSPTIMHNTIAGNVGVYGGGVRSLGNSSPLIVSNAIVDNVDGLYLTTNSGAIRANYNNLYYNSYQTSDYEVINNTSHIIDLSNNFWWVPDSSSIDSLIYGVGSFIPFHTAPNDSAPGEPSAVTSVTVMADKTYTKPVSSSLTTGDTLFIQLEGINWNSLFIEPALVIITSDEDSRGIGVALIETATSSGIYRGVAYIDTLSNDLQNRIGVGQNDTLIIRSNVDYTKCDTVIIEAAGVEKESREVGISSTFYLSQNYPNPFNPVTEIKYALPRDCYVTLAIYNVLGQKVASLVDAQQQAGYKTARWDASLFSSGIYFYRFQAGDFVQTRKMVVLK